MSGVVPLPKPGEVDNAPTTARSLMDLSASRSTPKRAERAVRPPSNGRISFMGPGHP